MRKTFGFDCPRGKEGKNFFFEKRSKKLLLIWGAVCGDDAHRKN